MECFPVQCEGAWSDSIRSQRNHRATNFLGVAVANDPNISRWELLMGKKVGNLRLGRVIRQIRDEEGDARRRAWRNTATIGTRRWLVEGMRREGRLRRESIVARDASGRLQGSFRMKGGVAVPSLGRIGPCIWLWRWRLRRGWWGRCIHLGDSVDITQSATILAIRRPVVFVHGVKQQKFWRRRRFR